MEPVEWAPLAISFIDSYHTSGHAPFKHSFSTRAVGTACCPIACGLCCIWSTVFRLLCCPIQCFNHGPAGACDENGCTKCCDASILECCSTYDKKNDLPPLTIPRILTPENKKAILDVLARLKRVFAEVPDIKSNVEVPKNYDSVHYTLTNEIVFPMLSLSGNYTCNLPANVMDFIASVESSLS